MIRSKKGVFLLVAGLFWGLSNGGVNAQSEPDLIFKKSTVFKFLSPDHKLATYAIDDPAVDGVTCYYTLPEKGGWVGWMRTDISGYAHGTKNRRRTGTGPVQPNGFPRATTTRDKRGASFSIV